MLAYLLIVRILHVDLQLYVGLYMYRYKSLFIFFQKKKGALSNILFNQNFIVFDLQIGA